LEKLRLALYIGIGVTCALGFAFPNPHPHFWWQKIPLFDAVFGFIGCIAIIFFAKWIGWHWLTRDKNYYD